MRLIEISKSKKTIRITEDGKTTEKPFSKANQKAARKRSRIVKARKMRCL